MLEKVYFVIQKKNSTKNLPIISASLFTDCRFAFLLTFGAKLLFFQNISVEILQITLKNCFGPYISLVCNN